MDFSELDCCRSLCTDSFYHFVKEMWSTIIPEKPVWNWHIKYLCDELQTVAERVFKGLPKEYDLVINVPPATSKSTIVSIMFPVWCLIRMKSSRTICATHTQTLGLDLSRKSRNVVRSEKFGSVFPDIQLEEDQDAKGYWVTKDGGSRFSCTVSGANPVGFHGHFLIVDDPIDPDKVLSKASQDTANQFMGDTLPSRKIDTLISVTILIMQRLGQNDPAANMLKKDGIRHICLPAEEQENIAPTDLRKYYKDGLLDPVRLPQSVLNEKKKRPYYYAGQYGQRPVPKGGGMFKVKVWDEKETTPVKLITVVRFWDTALTKGAGAFTAGVKMGDDGQNFWLLHVKKGQWEPGERNKAIRAIADMDGKDVEVCIEQPSGFGKESVENTIRSLAGYKARPEPVKGNKEARADPFADMVNIGAVKMLEGEWNQEYIDELEHFPNSVYKDQVDASSGAFARLIAIREEKAKKEKERRMLEGELLSNALPNGYTEKIKRERLNRQLESDNKDRESKITTASGDVVDIDWELK